MARKNTAENAKVAVPEASPVIQNDTVRIWTMQPDGTEGYTIHVPAMERAWSGANRSLIRTVLSDMIAAGNVSETPAVFQAFESLAPQSVDLKPFVRIAVDEKIPQGRYAAYFDITENGLDLLYVTESKKEKFG